MRAAIYGGSFNPVHTGHLGVARRALAELALDRLIVVPANVSPFKSEQPAVWDRVAQVKAAFRDLERTVVDLREIARGGVSYAIDTVREVRRELEAECAGAPLELFFIVGEDSVEGLPRWKDIDELRRLCVFRSFPRTHESSTAIRRLFEEGRVVLNPDSRLVRTVREGLERKGGYCPCRLPKLPEFFCPCDEFRSQLADPGFHGLCHCRLYLKP